MVVSFEGNVSFSLISASQANFDLTRFKNHKEPLVFILRRKIPSLFYSPFFLVSAKEVELGGDRALQHQGRADWCAHQPNQGNLQPPAEPL